MYDAQKLMKHQEEIGIRMEKFKFMVYLPKEKIYASIDKVKTKKYVTISGSELRNILDKGKEFPSGLHSQKLHLS